MPIIVDYADVLARCAQLGLISLYPNSGAFGFADDVPKETVGWLLSEDATIRPASRALATIVGGDAAGLAAKAVDAWRRMGDPVVWLLPKSHWAYELTFGNAEWLPAALGEAGVSATELERRHDGAAVAFSIDEAEAFASLLAAMIGRLVQSDFQLIFSSGRTVCTVHHHGQLWWSIRP